MDIYHRKRKLFFHILSRMGQVCAFLFIVGYLTYDQTALDYALERVAASFQQGLYRVDEEERQARILAAEEKRRATIEAYLAENQPKEPPKDENKVILGGGNIDIDYYCQTDSRWGEKMYGGNDSIGIYGCGPTALAMVVESLTGTEINPEGMSQWAASNGYFCPGSGSYHSLIPEGAQSFGLTVKGNINSPQGIIDELNAGRLVVALMSRGHFTEGGHFIILRGLTEDGKVLIADPKSLENSCLEWDLSIIVQEARYSASAGGPFWSIGKNGG